MLCVTIMVDTVIISIVNVTTVDPRSVFFRSFPVLKGKFQPIFPNSPQVDPVGWLAKEITQFLQSGQLQGRKLKHDQPIQGSFPITTILSTSNMNPFNCPI